MHARDRDHAVVVYQARALSTIDHRTIEALATVDRVGYVTERGRHLFAATETDSKAPSLMVWTRDETTPTPRLLRYPGRLQGSILSQNANTHTERVAFERSASLESVQASAVCNAGSNGRGRGHNGVVKRS